VASTHEVDPCTASRLRLLKEQDVFEVAGASGAVYQLEIQAVWDGRKKGVLRVRGSIDDEGWRALAPLVSDFIVRPDGTFVDE
jgi:hypothetical protein